jgi:hypothetical protein
VNKAPLWHLGHLKESKARGVDRILQFNNKSNQMILLKKNQTL